MFCLRIQEDVKDPSMPWWNCVSEHLVWLLALDWTWFFSTACNPSSQLFLPIPPLPNRLDWWASSSTMWPLTLKTSINHISSYPENFYFLLHLTQMQSAAEAENAASSHLLWYWSSLITMPFGGHSSLPFRCITLVPSQLLQLLSKLWNLHPPFARGPTASSPCSSPKRKWPKHLENSHLNHLSVLHPLQDFQWWLGFPKAVYSPSSSPCCLAVVPSINHHA